MDIVVPTNTHLSTTQYRRGEIYENISLAPTLFGGRLLLTTTGLCEDGTVNFQEVIAMRHLNPNQQHSRIRRSAKHSCRRPLN